MKTRIMRWRMLDTPIEARLCEAHEKFLRRTFGVSHVRVQSTRRNGICISCLIEEDLARKAKKAALAAK